MHIRDIFTQEEIDLAASRIDRYFWPLPQQEVESAFEHARNLCMMQQSREQVLVGALSFQQYRTANMAAKHPLLDADATLNEEALPVAAQLLREQHTSVRTAREQSVSGTPWDDCKVAFSVEDPRAAWAIDLSKSDMPEGWELVETDGTGARWVAVFRVTGVPIVADAERVLEILRRFKARAGRSETKGPIA